MTPAEARHLAGCARIAADGRGYAAGSTKSSYLRECATALDAMAAEVEATEERVIKAAVKVCALQPWPAERIATAIRAELRRAARGEDGK